jgi:predicted metalloprotease with PDZ domain
MPNRLTILATTLLTIIGCATPSTVLVNSEGRVIRCASYGWGTRPVIAAVTISTAYAIRDSCVRDAEMIGYVPLSTATTGLHLDWKTKPPTIDDVAGPSLKAGILKGDVLTHMDDEEITEPMAMLSIMSQKRVGDSMKLRIKRGADTLTFNVGLGKRGGANMARAPLKPLTTVSTTAAAPSNPPLSAAAGTPVVQTVPAVTTAVATKPVAPVSFINRAGGTVSCRPETPDNWGLTNCVLNAESQGFVRIPDVSAGMSLDWNSKPVRIIQSSGAAAEAGVRAGDILVEFDGTKITEPITIFKIVDKKQPGDYIIVKIIRGGKPINFTYRLLPK